MFWTALFFLLCALLFPVTFVYGPTTSLILMVAIIVVGILSMRK